MMASRSEISESLGGKHVLLLDAASSDLTIYQLILACTVEKSPEDFIFTRDDGEPIRDFRVAWWKACVVAGRGQFRSDNLSIDSRVHRREESRGFHFHA